MQTAVVILKIPLSDRPDGAAIHADRQLLASIQVTAEAGYLNCKAVVIIIRKFLQEKKLKRICHHLFLVASAFSVAACSFFGTNFAPQPFTLRDDGGFKIEEKNPFPIISATTVDGRNVPFLNSRKKIIVVYGGNCAYSDRALNKLSKKREIRRQDSDLIVLTAAGFMKGDINFNRMPRIKNLYIVVVPKSVSWSNSGIIGFPTIFTVNESGVVVHRYFGWHEGDEEKIN